MPLGAANSMGHAHVGLYGAGLDEGKGMGGGEGKCEAADSAGMDVQFWWGLNVDRWTVRDLPLAGVGAIRVRQLQSMAGGGAPPVGVGTVQLAAGAEALPVCLPPPSAPCPPPCPTHLVPKGH